MAPNGEPGTGPSAPLQPSRRGGAESQATLRRPSRRLAQEAAPKRAPFPVRCEASTFTCSSSLSVFDQPPLVRLGCYSTSVCGVTVSYSDGVGFGSVKVWREIRPGHHSRSQEHHLAIWLVRRTPCPTAGSSVGTLPRTGRNYNRVFVQSAPRQQVEWHKYCRCSTFSNSLPVTSRTGFPVRGGMLPNRDPQKVGEGRENN